MKKLGITLVLIVAICFATIGCAKPDVPYCTKEKAIELAESQFGLRFSAFPARLVEGATSAIYDGDHVWTVGIKVEKLEQGPSGLSGTGEYSFVVYKFHEPENCK